MHERACVTIELSLTEASVKINPVWYLKRNGEIEVYRSCNVDKKSFFHLHFSCLFSRSFHGSSVRKESNSVFTDSHGAFIKDFVYTYR